MMGLLCFADASTLQNDRDNPPEGIQANQSREAPMEAPESPAMDAAKTRHEDNFGIPLDALYLSPPVGTQAAGARERAGAAQPNRAVERANN